LRQVTGVIVAATADAMQARKEPLWYTAHIVCIGTPAILVVGNRALRART